MLAVLHEPRFVDLAPAEVYATLLDEGRYLCSERTMYRLLAAHQEVRERQNQLRHPRYATPELLARWPNELWSWDQLTIHADRGPAITSKPVALLLPDLGVTKTHSRPHVSNDNPFSEAQFKTLKYRPTFPERFGSIQDARAHCHVFFAWYNTEHRHSSRGLLTPADVHHGLAGQRIATRETVLAAAYEAHPERFPGGLPQPRACPREVWINRPRTPVTEEASSAIACEAAVSFRAESAILDPPGASG